jgi:hypothetical protein
VAIPQHSVPSIVGYGKDVRLFFSDLLSSVPLNVFGIVNGQFSVRVDGHKDGACVGLSQYNRNINKQTTHHRRHQQANNTP